MSLYLTNKSGYNTLRDSGLLSIPDPYILAGIKKDLKINPGGDPSIYKSFLSEVTSCKHDVVGQLMMDEIKLKHGIAFNVQNNKIKGFVVDQLNKKEMFENILNIKKMKKPEIQLQCT